MPARSMEKEAVAQIAAMFEDGSSASGICAAAARWRIWRRCGCAGQLFIPGKKIVASVSGALLRTAEISGVLKLPFQAVATDSRGRMDIVALTKLVKAGDIGCVVATMGTTGTGSIDPLPEILKLSEKHGFRVHVDSAYGGYFALASSLSAGTQAAFEEIARADSVVIDPHKHGLQPYGCGCVLFRDSAVGALYKHESPYTYFTHADLHLGEITLECSRPGASAVALWATQQLLPLERGGEFAENVGRLPAICRGVLELILGDSRWVLPLTPELDIVVWAPRAETAAKTSALAQSVFDEAAKRNLPSRVDPFAGAIFRERKSRARMARNGRNGAMPAIRADEARAPRLASENLGNSIRSRGRRTEGLNRPSGRNTIPFRRLGCDISSPVRPRFRRTEDSMPPRRTIYVKSCSRPIQNTGGSRKNTCGANRNSSQLVTQTYWKQEDLEQEIRLKKTKLHLKDLMELIVVTQYCKLPH